MFSYSDLVRHLAVAALEAMTFEAAGSHGLAACRAHDCTWLAGQITKLRHRDNATPLFASEAR